MKQKLFTLLTLLVLCVTGAWAETYTFNCYNSGDYWSSSSGTVTSVKDAAGSIVFSAVFAKVDGDNNGCSGSTIDAGYITLRKGNTLTISSATKTFVTATIVFNSKDTGPAKKDNWTDYFTVDKGTLTKISDTEFLWEGDATNSVTFTDVKTGSSDFDMRVKTIIVNTVLVTGVKVNDAQSGAAAYLDNAGGISGDKKTKSFSSPYFTLSGENIQSGSGTFTIDTKNFTPFKIGQSKDVEYEIVPARGATITAASVYVTSNSTTVPCKINGESTANKGGTPTKIDLSESAGKWKFTFQYSDGFYNQALIVLKVTYNSPANVDVTVSSAGYATLFYDKNLVVPTGVTAYKASVNGSNIALTDIGALIPANTGVILEAAQATYNFITTNADASGVDVDGNILTGTTTATTKATLGSTVYTLGQNGEGEVGLRSYTGTDIRAYSAYSTSISLARDFYAFDEDVTAINKVEAKKVENGVFYNLAGQQVAQPTKGLYIVNGKKVVLK